jgi:hypothetical protein
MSFQKEMHVWRGLGVGAVFAAMLLMGAVIADFVAHGHELDRDLLKFIVVAGIAEMLGVTLLSVSRCMQRMQSARSAGWPLGWVLVALGLGGIGWYGHQAATNYTASVVVFQLIATMVLAGGIAMLGTERLLKHFTEGARQSAIDDTVPA